MKPAEIKAAFPTEAVLCDCFIASLREIGGWTIYPETAGFDILAVYDATGHQLGVEAKLALNAKVADQIFPHEYEAEGPDFRAVIVPALTDASHGIARLLTVLGVNVWAPRFDYRFCDGAKKYDRTPRFDHAVGGTWRVKHAEYDSTADPDNAHRGVWHDWNPIRRCDLPSMVPTVRAGVPSPIRLTPWKIGALKVMAEIELTGFVTAQSIRVYGIDPRRFCASDGWLQSLGEGRWGPGKIPRFDQQHPAEYAAILAASKDAGLPGKLA